ncbi:MAG: tetratricopeptide repeat protein [Gemmatimonadota bacterium]
MKRSLWCALVFAAFAQVAAAQDPVAAALTAGAAGAFADPAKECSDLLKGGDFRVSSGKTYYKTAMSQSDSGNRNRILRNAQTNLTDAIVAGQGKLATSWYWLGKADMALGDLTGADSAYTKAVGLAPGCKSDLDTSRQLVWFRLLGLANDKQKAGDNPTALLFYRAANKVYSDSPLAYLNMAALFGQTQQNDSALHYFEAAAAAPYSKTDTSAVSMHNQSLYNAGVMQIGAKQWPAAIATFHAYVSQNPEDADGKKGLAQAFQGAGMADSAQAIMSSIGLTAGGATKNPLDSVFQVGVVQFNAKDYKGADAAFATVLQSLPFQREALYNRANAQLALKDGPGLTATSKVMMSLEPLNDKYVSLAVAGFQLTKNQADLTKLATDLVGWPVAIDVTDFTPGENATLTGTATGRDPKDAAGKTLKPAPVGIVFDFLDASGAVLASKEATIPALTPGQSSPIQLSASAKGITTWRYHRK